MCSSPDDNSHVPRPSVKSRPTPFYIYSLRTLLLASFRGFSSISYSALDFFHLLIPPSLSLAFVASSHSSSFVQQYYSRVFLLGSLKSLSLHQLFSLYLSLKISRFRANPSVVCSWPSFWGREKKERGKHGQLFPEAIETLSAGEVTRQLVDINSAAVRRRSSSAAATATAGPTSDSLRP